MSRRRLRRPVGPTDPGRPDEEVAARLAVGPVRGSRYASWPRWRGRGGLPSLSHRPGLPREHEVVAASVGWLRRMIPGSRSLGETTRLRVRIVSWESPWSGWVGRTGHVPWLASMSYEAPPSGSGPFVIDVRTSRPVAATVLLQAVLPLLAPHRRPPGTYTVEVAGHTAAAAPWADPAHDTWLDRSDTTITPGFRAFDVVVTDEDRAQPVASSDTGATLTSSRGSRLLVAGSHRLVGLDPTTVNPVGREVGSVLRYDLDRAPHRLAATPRGWALLDPTGATLARVSRRGLTDLDARVLRRVDRIVVEDLGAHAAHQRAHLLVGLAACGVVVAASDVPREVSDLVAPDLLDLMRAPVPHTPLGALELEVRSAALVREAMRHHDARRAVDAFAADVFGVGSATPSVSVLLITNRPELVGRAVAGVRKQDYPDLELVLGMHGFGFGEEQLGAALGDFRARTKAVPLPADLPMVAGIARMASVAEGALLAKMDDDDWYAVEHVTDLVTARRYSGAHLTGQPLGFVHMVAQDRLGLRRDRRAHRFHQGVAGGTVLVSRADAESVGGWRPLTTAEDTAVTRRILRAGGLVYGGHGWGYVYERRASGHTWATAPPDLLLDASWEHSGLLAHPALGTESPPDCSSGAALQPSVSGRP